MIRTDEAGIYLAELAMTAGYATLLESLDRRYEPDWTWLTVMVGVVISTAPAQILARRTPGDWRDYERRVVTGFCISGLIIVGWQLWQMARRHGEAHGYALGRRRQETDDHANSSKEMEF